MSFFRWPLSEHSFWSDALGLDIMRNPVPILLYHAVTTNPATWIAPFAVSPATFAAHMDVVVASGRRPLTISQYIDGLRGKFLIPSRAVVITVDDGFADFAENVLPALVDRKMSSTLYMTTGAFADRENDCVLPAARMLRSADLPGLEASGVEIGAHSHTHRQLDLLPNHIVAYELKRSGTLLAEILGHDIRSFAYPHGYWRSSMRRLVVNAGFDSACGVGEAFSSGKDHPLALSRLMIRSDTDVAKVRQWMYQSDAKVISPSCRILACGWRQYRRAKQLKGSRMGFPL